MVAISLHRGDMHEVSPELPRRWLMPTREITLKDFRTLLHRRSKTISVLPSSSGNVAVASTAAAGASDLNLPAKEEAVSGNPDLTPPEFLMGLGTFVGDIEVENYNGNFNGIDFGAKVLDLVASLNVEEKEEEKEEKVAVVECEKEKINGQRLVVEIPVFEGREKLGNADDTEKNQMTVEEKLKILTEKKHNLVQALKQILNAEEELKRRACMQAGRPPLPSNDSGSMTCHATPRTGSEANFTSDVEGREGDDALNHNPQSRLLLHMNSTSPDAESALRRPLYSHHKATSDPSRASIVAAGSPSRFAPGGNQGQSSNLPSVSVSRTNYVASSPCPAGSGGTSGFRDAQHTSPGN